MMFHFYFHDFYDSNILHIVLNCKENDDSAVVIHNSERKKKNTTSSTPPHSSMQDLTF